MSEPLQSEYWSGVFGEEYTRRNDFNQAGLDKLYMKYFGITRTDLNKKFLDNLDKDMNILEVGCNTGMQLTNLNTLGFSNLSGIDVSKAGLEVAKTKLPEANLSEASALNLPFEDNKFDIVFTSGVLIHINPKDIDKVIDEIYRTSKKYIWCCEYFADKCEEVDYRGNRGLLWKNDFMGLFLQKYPNLRIVKERKLKYRDGNNVDHMFLLEK